MKVMKFGGTSVGKPERMHHIVSLVTKEEEPTIVVLSALSGTTKKLRRVPHYYYRNLWRALRRPHAVLSLD